MARGKSVNSIIAITCVMFIFVIIQLCIWHYEHILDIARSSVNYIYSSDIINGIIKPNICKQINTTHKMVNNITVNCGYGGYGNFLESHFHTMSCQCLLLLSNYTNITYFNDGYRQNWRNQYYYNFVEFVPQKLEYIDSVCESFLCNIEKQNMREFYIRQRTSICFTKLAPTPWASRGLMAYHNKAFIPTISKALNGSMKKYNENYRNTSNEEYLILNECDITIHVRLGDYIKRKKGSCWPRVGLFAVSYFSDCIDTILSRMYHCKNVNIRNKNIYIVTQLSKDSVRNHPDISLSDLGNQVIYLYQRELNKIYNEYGYNTTLVSTSLMNDWDILRRSRNLICVTSTFCHTASLTNIHGLDLNLIIPGNALFHPFSKLRDKWGNTWPSNHIPYIPKDNFISSCQLFSLEWNNIGNIHKFLSWIKHPYELQSSCKFKGIDPKSKIIITLPVPCGFGGFGNFLEKYFHQMSCQCLLLLQNPKNITRFDHTIKKTGFNKYYHHFVEFVPQGLEYIDSICKPFICDINDNNLGEYYINRTKEICLTWQNLKPAEWGSVGLVAYHNTPFINALSTQFNNLFTKYYQKYNDSNNIDIILNECDITIHARLGDFIDSRKGCWPRVGFFALSYFEDSINAILKRMDHCKNSDISNKIIYIVTQLSKEAMRNTIYSSVHNITNEIVYLYKHGIDNIFQKYGYKTQLISTSIINDWNILRRSKNLICVTSTYCHTAGITSKYGSNINLVIPGVGTFAPFSKIKKYWENTFPSGHMGYIPTNNYMPSCKLHQLGWKNGTNIHKFLDWIKNPKSV